MKPLAASVFLFIGIVYLLMHFYIMVDPQNLFYRLTPNFDKVEHLISGFVLAGITFSMLKHKNAGAIAFATVLGLGIIFEIIELQTVYGGFPDGFIDIIFNQIGAGIAIFLLNVNSFYQS